MRGPLTARLPGLKQGEPVHHHPVAEPGSAGERSSTSVRSTDERLRPADRSVRAAIAEAHVHTYRGAALTGSQFDQVAHLVDQEQSVAPAVRRALDSPG